MAGHVVSLYLRSCGHEVEGAGTEQLSGISEVIFDVRDLPSLGSSYALFDGDYDVVVNCVALLVKPSDENPALAILLNSYFPRYLEQYFVTSSTRIIHISTDEVFDGQPPFDEMASAKGNGRIYGQTKALGELINGKDLTVRLSIIGPTLTKAAPSLLNWFLSDSDKYLHGYSNAYWSGVTTFELAKLINYLISHVTTGVYHLVAPEPISKLQLLELVNQNIYSNTNHTKRILKDDSVKVDRTMLNTRTDVDYAVPDYQTMLDQLRNWIDDHIAIYPHYS
jgi:dTDP-4-dehydrorhamnose reductase